MASKEPHPSSSATPTAYTMSALEQAFVDGVVTPWKCSNIAEIQGVMENDLRKVFAAVCAEVGQEIG